MISPPRPVVSLPTRILAAVLGAIFLGACSGSREGATADGTSASASAGVQVNGAGATFPYPIYSKWFAEYNQLHPNVRINYQSLGSGAGIRQLINRTVFFGASDQPMDEAEMKAAPGKILHFPTVLGAVVPIYNLPGVTEDVKFTGPIIADIVLGKVGKWNDPELLKQNPGVALPDMNITLVHRSDGSGTTFIFADYLAKVSPEFKSRVGVDSALKWPTGVGGKGNEGVSGLVRQTPGAIGYVELVYALQTKIPYGAIQNSDGVFVRASIETVTAAAETMEIPPDFRVSITNPPGQNAYPIASFTWLLLYQDPPDKEKSRTMVDFTRWAITDGQRFAADLGYAPLPRNLAEKEMQTLDQIRVQ
jgi:phosphate transport system substrate-binding protein